MTYVNKLPLLLLVSGFLAACATEGGVTVADNGVARACDDYVSGLHLKNSSRGGILSATALADANFRAAGLRDLKQQGFFSEDELALIENGRLAVGARSDIVRCVLGNPAEIKKVSLGLSNAETWIYPGFGLNVDIERGLVKGWRN